MSTSIDFLKTQICFLNVLRAQVFLVKRVGFLPIKLKQVSFMAKYLNGVLNNNHGGYSVSIIVIILESLLHIFSGFFLL